MATKRTPAAGRPNILVIRGDDIGIGHATGQFGVSAQPFPDMVGQC